VLERKRKQARRAKHRKLLQVLLRVDLGSNGEQNKLSSMYRQAERRMHAWPLGLVVSMRVGFEAIMPGYKVVYVHVLSW